MQYVCLSRKDYNQTEHNDIQISTSNHMDVGQINKPFSTVFEVNNTKAKCYSDEAWAQQWFDISAWEAILCVTSTKLVADIFWE